METLKKYIDDAYEHLDTVDDRMSEAAKRFGKSKRTIYSWVASGTHFYTQGKIVEVKA